MGIQFAVHTFGHFDAMFYILNGIKMIMDSDFADGLIKLMAMITTGYYGVQMMAHAQEGRTGHYFLKTASMLMMINALLLPRADMLVVDRVTGRKELVTNLPYAFVLPVGALEAFGAGITAAFEQAFTPVGSTPYKDYGLVFGQRLVQESRNWRIASPEFAKNMDVFLNRCVVLESMIGTRFTPEDILNTDDILYLATERAGTFRTVDFKIRGVGSRLTCRDAGRELYKYLNGELTNLSRRYLGTDFTLAGSNGAPSGAAPLNQLLARNIEIGYKAALGVENDASSLIRQTMMINAVHDYSNSADLYGYSRASLMQESSWKISGDLAKEYLPLLLNVMKGMIYASFIFIVPLMVLSGGISRYMKYIEVIASLQLWPALNAILNLFIELYSNLQGTGITGGSITYASYNQSHNMIDKIVLVASGLQMTIPFLAFNIVQGGVGGFIHLAQSLAAGNAQVSSAASAEVTSGNRSFDNIAQGNRQYAQQIAHKTDWNSSYASGSSSNVLSDGSREVVHQNGDVSVMSGAGINKSTGSNKFDLQQGATNQASMGLTKTEGLVKAAENSFHSARNATIASSADLVSHMAQRKSTGETFNYEALGEQGKALQQAVNHTSMLREQNGYGWEQSAATAVEAAANATMKSPTLFGTQLDGSIGAKGTMSANNTNNQSLTDESQVSTENHSNSSFNDIVRSAQNSSWMKDNSIDTSFAETTRANYEEMQSSSQTLSARQDEAQSYSEALNKLESSGANSSQDMYHVVEERVQEEYGVSQYDAHQMIENNDAKVSKVWGDIVNENVQEVMSEINDGRGHISGAQADAEMQSFGNQANAHVDSNVLNTVTSHASNVGLSHSQMQSGINSASSYLQTQGASLKQDNYRKQVSVQGYNEALRSTMESRADKYEANRSGTGGAVKSKIEEVNDKLGTDFAPRIGGPTRSDSSAKELQQQAPNFRKR